MDGCKYGILVAEFWESGGNMQKLLIAERDEVLRGVLVDLLRRTYDITTCADGATALDLIRSLRPDAVILDMMLPVMDGFYIMEQLQAERPPVVLGICDFCNDYTNQTARDLGVSFMIRKPCLPRVIAGRLEHLLRHVPAPDQADSQTKAVQLLLQFRFNPKNDGFRFLKIGLPLYAQDPQQRVCKELYATIAQICGVGSWNQVERSIRTAIDTAWRTRAEIWDQYFPDSDTAPTGKTFISRVSQMLSDL